MERNNLERKKLKEIIHSIDYLNAKDRYSYTDKEFDPFNHLDDIINKWNDVTFPELKDAFEAFEKKICINSYPEAFSPAFDLAELTADVLIRIASFVVTWLERADLLDLLDLVDAEPTKATQVSETILHALIALFKAGLRSTHCKLADMLMECDTPSMKKYIKSLGRESLVQLIAAAQVKFLHVPSDNCEEVEQASCQRYTLRRIFNMLSSDQLKLVQREVIDTYLYYLSQAPSLSETFLLELKYILRDINDKCKDENLFLDLKDLDAICKTFCVIQDVACCQSYVKDAPIDDIVTRILKHVIKAILEDGILSDVFEQLVQVIIQISKDDKTGKQKENIYMTLRTKLFSNLQKYKVQELYKPCIGMVMGVLSQDVVSTEAESMIKAAVEAIILEVNPGCSEEIAMYLLSVCAILLSGKEQLLKLGKELLKRLKKMRGFDWKNHVNKAEDVMITIRDIPGSKAEGSYWDYRDFLEELEAQFKKDKILPKLQSIIRSCFFGCLSENSRRKQDIAAVIAMKGFIVFSRGDNLARIDVLERCQHILTKTEHFWDASAVARILRRVIESYGGSGKMVTERESTLIMSIFTFVVQGGDSVLKHFYEEENENTSNTNFLVLDEFKFFILPDLKANTFNAMIPEIIRWLKKASTENHEDMMKLTIELLKNIAQYYLTDLKDVLQDVVDVMIKMEMYDQLSDLVKALYPLNPNALDNQLTDMLDKMDDYQEPMQISVLFLIDDTIASTHPEIFTSSQILKLFDLCSTADVCRQALTLSIICHIAESIPDQIIEFLPQLFDESLFNPDTMGDYEYLRVKVIYLTGLADQIAGQKVIEYMMSYVANTSTSTTICTYVMGVLEALITQYHCKTGKYTDQFKALQETMIHKTEREAAPNLLMIGGMTFIEGKNVVRDMEQQEENIAELDTKVDVAMDSVVTIGDKVMEHEKEIIELGDGLERLDEKLVDVDLS